MKLDETAVQLAAGEGDWSEVLRVFARHFGVPEIAALDIEPRVYERPASYYRYKVIMPRDMFHIYIRCGGREYRADYAGLYDLDVPWANCDDSFVVISIRAGI